MTNDELTTLLESLPAIARVSGIAAAGRDAVVFAEEPKAFAEAVRSGAGMIVTTAELAAGTNDARLVLVREPKYVFAMMAKALAPMPVEPLIHPSATVDVSAKLGARVQVGAGGVVERGVVIGEASVIGAGAKVLQGVVLGARCVVQAGAVLGSTGFGFVRHAATGEYVMFPQQGELIVEDDVEIGANSTIDRGALGETRIGRGTKIDNLVHIGHNCVIGKNVVIAAQVGISGSCVVEDGAILAGQVGISDHCHIGPGVILGGQAGVFRGATVEGPGQMFAGTPAEPLKNFLKSLARVRRLK